VLSGSVLLGVLAQTVALLVAPRDQPPPNTSAPSGPSAPTPNTSEPPAPVAVDQPPAAQTPINPDAPMAGATRPVPPAEPPGWQPRRFGVHLGINATFAFDASIGRLFYAGVATQLTGLAAPFVPDRNFNLTLLAFGGVALPILERESLRFTADIAPSFGYTRAAPVNLLSVGLLAGVRLVLRSGFTFAVKLPLVGYAGAPDAQRGGLLTYYINAIVAAPAITFGYSF
jgi:hypothetical protein